MRPTGVQEFEVSCAWLTRHAWHRMCARRLSLEAILAVLRFGRSAFVRGAEVFAVGRKEVEKYKRHGINLSAYEGLQVVCTTDGHVVTAYRNHDFRGLRPWSRRDHRILN